MRISDWSSDVCSSDLALPCDWMQVEAVRRLVRDEGGSMSTPPLKMRNIGPKSAAWLRQVGLRTPEDLAEAGPLEDFKRSKIGRATGREGVSTSVSLAGVTVQLKKT